jgi:hypothetical protein
MFITEKSKRNRYYKNLVYENDKVNIIDTNSIITHIIGIDFNSLYPSSYSSKHYPLILIQTEQCICLSKKLLKVKKKQGK